MDIQGPAETARSRCAKDSDELVALTYNLSWAVAKNQKSGSESYFVENMCFNKEDGFCRKNAMQSLQRMKIKPDVIAFQEYIPWERRMCDKLTQQHGVFIETEPLTDSHIIASNQTMLKTVMAENADVVGYIAGIQADRFFASLCTCWDKNELGDKDKHMCLQLSEGVDLRPCYIALTQQGYLLINMQAPQPKTKALLECIHQVNNSCENMMNKAEKARVRAIVLLGDFNDGESIFSNHLVKLIGKPLIHPSKLKTCCYDPVDGGMDKNANYNFPGDYVMSTMKTHKNPNRVLYDGSLSSENAKAPPEDEGRSDHDPVVASFLKTPITT
jgi:hypothetical protein